MRNSIIVISISFFCFSALFSQDFKYKGLNLFGLKDKPTSANQTAIKLIFYDLDNDGDKDAIVTGIDSIDFSGNFGFDKVKYFILYQENIGNKRSPSFGPPKPIIDKFPFPNGYFFPAIGDLNNDGKPDFMVSSGLDSINRVQTLYFQRKSLIGDNQFNIINSDSLDLDVFTPGSLFLPELTDLDGDGDLDLLMSGFIGRRNANGENIQVQSFMYAENIGTPSQPKWLGWYENPYGIIPTENQPQICVAGDLDNDGDIDLLSLKLFDSKSFFGFWKNISSSKNNPKFQAPVFSPFGLPSAGEDETLLPPTLVDIDGDGDLDLFVIQGLIGKGEGIGYYENNLCVSSSVNVNRIICMGDSVKIGDKIFKSTGQFEASLKNVNGCDSIVNLNLTVIPAPTVNIAKSICQGQIYSIGNQSFTQTGMYQVKLTSAMGCDSIVNLNLSVDPITVTNLVKTICQGEVFKIGNQSYNQTGQYQVKLSTTAECDSIVNANLTFLSLKNSVTQTLHSLTADLPDVTYQWIDCVSGLNITGAIGQIFQPLKSGKYKVKLMDTNGCSSISNCIDFIPTGTFDEDISDKISLYPNPTNDFVIVVNESGLKIKSISFISLTGQKALTIDEGDFTRISTSSFPLGHYIVEIQTEKLKVIRKLTIIK
ncbi:MAG: T9SS type A sorting domain-containing protein [Saprospiraceae bacterium]